MPAFALHQPLVSGTTAWMLSYVSSVLSASATELTDTDNAATKTLDPIRRTSGLRQVTGASCLHDFPAVRTSTGFHVFGRRLAILQRDLLLHDAALGRAGHSGLRDFGGGRRGRSRGSRGRRRFRGDCRSAVRLEQID